MRKKRGYQTGGLIDPFYPFPNTNNKKHDYSITALTNTPYIKFGDVNEASFKNPEKNNYYYDPYNGRVLERDPVSGKYRKLSNSERHEKGILFDGRAGITNEVITAHIKQYPDQRLATPLSNNSNVNQVFNDVQAYNKDYINSEDYIERLQNEGFKNASGIKNERARRANNKIKFLPDAESSQLIKKIGNPILTFADHVNPNSKENLELKKLYGTTATNESVMAHELTHNYESSDINSFGPKALDNIISGIYRDPITSHDKEPKEIKADLDALRYRLIQDNFITREVGNKGNSKTPNDFVDEKQKLKDNFKMIKQKYGEDAVFKRLFNSIKDDNIIEHLLHYSVIKDKESIQNVAMGGPINSSNVKTFDSNKLKAVQLDLKNKGLYKGKVDGIYGPLTEAAITAYNENTLVERTLPEFNIISARPGSSRLNDLQKLKVLEEEHDLNAYNIWEKGGKPKIYQDTSITGLGGDRANYNPFTNSITIRSSVAPSFAALDEETQKKIKEAIASESDYFPEELDNALNNAPKLEIGNFDDFLAEMSHSIQNKSQNLKLRGVKDWINDPYITNKGQRRLYRTKGSLEHDAHSIIQPQLDRYTQGLRVSKIDVPLPNNFQTGGLMKRNKRNCATGGYVNPYQLATQQALAGYNQPYGTPYAMDTTNIMQMAGGTAPLQLNPTQPTNISTTASNGTTTASNAGGIGAGADPYSAVAAMASQYVTQTVGDYASAFNYKPTLGKEKSQSDYTKEAIMAGLKGGVVGTIPTLIRQNKDKNTMVWGSPGTYATGGNMDQSLSNQAFQVKDNPNITDGKYYPEYNANLDHNEVVDKNSKFVFSDDLKMGDKSFAQQVKPIYKKLGEIENRKDSISQTTAAMYKKQINDIAMTQEELATSLGLRNNSNNYAVGGFTQGPGDPKGLLEIRSDKSGGMTLYYDPKNQKIYQNANGNYLDITDQSKKLLTSIQGSLSGRATANPKSYLVNPPTNIPKPFNTTDALSPFGIQSTVPERVDTYTPRGPGSQTPVATSQATAPVTSGTTGKGGSSAKGLPWEGFDVAQFQTWYNSLPGAKAMPVDGKWGPVTKAAYEDVAYDYLNATGKNQITSMGPQSYVGDWQNTGYVDITPKNGVITPTTIGELQQVPPRGTIINTPEGPVDISQLDGSIPVDPTPETMADRRQRITVPESSIYNAYRDQGIDAVTARNLAASGVAPTITPQTGELGTTGTLDADIAAALGQFTLGDALQGVEVGSKFFNLLEGPETEPQILNTTPITKVGYDPRTALLQNQRNYQNALNSVGTSSMSTRRAVANSMLANKLNMDNQVLTNYQNMNNEALVNYENRLSNQRQQNIASEFNTNNLNAANRGAYDQAQQNAFTSLGNFGEALNRKQRSQDMIMLLKQRYPDIYDSFMKDVNTMTTSGKLQLKFG